MNRRRGSTLVESAFALLAFAVLLGGIMEAGFVLYAANSVTFAAQRAARWASVRGSGSGHPASRDDVQAIAQSCAAPLSAESIAVNVTWSPDNNPGSTVQVRVQYSIKPGILPLSAGVLTLGRTSRQTIAQ